MNYQNLEPFDLETEVAKFEFYMKQNSIYWITTHTHPRIPSSDFARYINPWDNKLSFFRCTAEWILSFHWLHHHFRMSKMTNENDPYKTAVIWLDRKL